MRTPVLLAGALAAVCSQVSAQVSDVFICDDKNERIFRLVDLNGDGLFATLNEAVVFVDHLALNVDLNVAGFAAGPNGPIVYWNTTSTQDGIWRGEDGNGNGVIDQSEMVLFYDATGAGENIDSEGLAVAADGAVWWSSDFSGAQGIWRARDLNADGDALDAGETVRLVNAGTQGSNPQITIETDAGPALIHTADFWRMAADGNGIVVYEGFSSSCLTSEDVLVRFEDKNNDGDVSDSGESRLFLNPHDKGAPTNDLPANPDFLSGTLPSMKLNTNGTAVGCVLPNYFRMNVVASRQEGAQRAFYLSGDVSNTSTTFNTNINGKGLNGVIFRAVDSNGDKDVNDAGEVKLFYDGSYNGPFQGSNLEIDKNVGMHGAPDGLWVGRLVNGGSMCRLRDLNGDGDAMDQQVDIGGGVLVDEMKLDVWDYTTWGPNPPFPAPPATFPGPFIKDIAAYAAGAWAVPVPPTPGFVTSGTGCSGWGTVPSQGMTGTPSVGTTNLAALLSNVPGGTPAGLMVGDSTTTWFGIPLPFDLAVFGFSGCTLYQNVVVSVGVTTTGTAAASATDGVAQIALPIPNKPAWVGFNLPLQWYAVNAYTLPSPTIGFTGLGTVTILP